MPTIANKTAAAVVLPGASGRWIEIPAGGAADVTAAELTALLARKSIASTFEAGELQAIGVPDIAEQPGHATPVADPAPADPAPVQVKPRAPRAPKPKA